MLSLLAWATTAYAECAWVLWAETIGLRYYETVSASGTREVYERALGKQIARWKTAQASPAGKRAP
jgi:hypothetical protein